MAKSPFKDIITQSQELFEQQLQQEVAQNMTEVVKPTFQSTQVSITAEAYKDYIDTLKDNISRLQDWVDDYADQVILRIKNDVIDYRTAVGSQHVYDIAWFSKQVYSDDKLSQIAETLIKQSQKYGLTPSLFWHRIVIGDFSELTYPKIEQITRGMRRMGFNDAFND